LATSNNGAITQSTNSGLTVNGTSNLNAGTGAITLNTGSNDFQQTVSLVAGDMTQITDRGALTLGTLSTGTLLVVSDGALNLGSGTVNGAFGALSNNGAITQTGGLTVVGNSNIQAGSGAITLTHGSNDFRAGMILDGTGISVVNAGDLVVSSLTNGANGAIALTAGGALNVVTPSLDTGSGDLTLIANGGALNTTGTL
ncbi:hypothetical protein, partial [Xanthomonas maliensis]